ncbi:putative acyl-coenzyme A thioesterase 13 [Helianthus annuus]|nr:putative acyl-coenzyme A thioesterase 13 [Helianthus annuus]KAJ0596747.1 putative acyl-coenzyme A thioesterase 13 [Helianthus annuus]KAJ0757424.1 putative acyl-coenzyme A thioesterase 13 [Helianthus annuus]KAJ0761123.1 putative acyl-coenzyme A thioesterase 13 [Helianthus annuus]
MVFIMMVWSPIGVTPTHRMTPHKSYCPPLDHKHDGVLFVYMLMLDNVPCWQDELEISAKLLGGKGAYNGTLVHVKNKASGVLIAEGRHSLFSKPVSKI